MLLFCLTEMMKKVSGMVDAEVVLKYQLIPEDLDTLVSVRTEEDLKHMMEEHDRHESGGSPLLRAFLFPSKPLLLDNHQLQGQHHHLHLHPPPPPLEPYMLEQRYIDAINGIIRTSPRGGRLTATTPCSACSSPKSSSPDGHTAESPFHNNAAASSQFHQGRLAMNKVRSSPSLTNLNNTHQQQQTPHEHGNVSHNNYHHPHAAAYPSSLARPTQQLEGQGGFGMGRPPPVNVMTDFGTGGRGVNVNYYYPTSRPHKGGGGYNAAYHDDSPAYGGGGGGHGHGHVVIDRVHSVPRSPRKSIWD